MEAVLCCFGSAAHWWGSLWHGPWHEKRDIGRADISVAILLCAGSVLSALCPEDGKLSTQELADVSFPPDWWQRAGRKLMLPEKERLNLGCWGAVTVPLLRCSVLRTLCLWPCQLLPPGLGGCWYQMVQQESVGYCPGSGCSLPPRCLQRVWGGKARLWQVCAGSAVCL